jgi:hypothetical protein
MAAAAVLPGVAAQAAEQQLLLQQQHHRQFEQIRLLQEIDSKLQMLQLLQGAPVTNASVAAVQLASAPVLLNALAGMNGSYSSAAPVEVADPLSAMRSSAAATTAALLGSPTGSGMVAPPWQQQQQAAMLCGSPRSSNGSSRSASPGGAFVVAPAVSAGGNNSHLFPLSLAGVGVGAVAPGCIDLLACSPTTCVPSSTWGVMNGTVLI